MSIDKTVQEVKLLETMSIERPDLLTVFANYQKEYEKSNPPKETMDLKQRQEYHFRQFDYALRRLREECIVNSSGLNYNSLNLFRFVPYSAYICLLTSVRCVSHLKSFLFWLVRI